MATALTGLTIHELTDRYRRGDARPSQAAEAYLARIEKLDEQVGAYVTVIREQALAAARAGCPPRSGRRPPRPRGGCRPG